MNRQRKLDMVILLVLTVVSCFSICGAEPEGYAGPGWSVLFGTDGSAEIAGLGPVMFHLGGGTYFGPVVAYEESSAAGPASFLGGAKLELTSALLSRGFYSTSLAVAIMAGAVHLDGTPELAAQINTEIDANFMLFPSLCLSVGPLMAIRMKPEGPVFMPGFTFSLKEGHRDGQEPLIGSAEGKLRIGGYWQGLITFVHGTPIFIDGGGTRIELPLGLAFGVTGGVLRQGILRENHALSIMLFGLTAGWNGHITDWLTLTGRVTTGVAMYGWLAPDQSIEGGPHFMIRPEACVFLRVFPFLRIGGGVGYQFVAGEAVTTIPLGRLSSVAFSIQARVGGE